MIVMVEVSRMLLWKMVFSRCGILLKKVGVMMGIMFMLMLMVMMKRLLWLLWKLILDRILMLVVVIILNIMMLVLFSMNCGIDVVMCVILGNRLNVIRIILVVM